MLRSDSTSLLAKNAAAQHIAPFSQTIQPDPQHTQAQPSPLKSNKRVSPPASLFVPRISRPRHISQQFRSLFRASSSRPSSTDKQNDSTLHVQDQYTRPGVGTTSPTNPHLLKKRWSCADIRAVPSRDSPLHEEDEDPVLPEVPGNGGLDQNGLSTTQIQPAINPINTQPTNVFPTFSKKAAAKPNRPNLVPLVIQHAPLSSGPALMSPTHVAFLRTNLAQVSSHQHSVPSNVGTSTETMHAFHNKHDYHAQLFEINQQMASLGHTQHLHQQHMHATQVYANPAQARDVPLGVPTANPKLVVPPPSRSISQTPTHAPQPAQKQSVPNVIVPKTSITASTVNKHPKLATATPSTKWNENCKSGKPIKHAADLSSSLMIPAPPSKSVAQNLLHKCKLVPEFEHKYIVGDELGSGGFGFVVTATRVTDNTEVAVKFIFKDKVPVHSLVKDPVLGIIPMEVYILINMQHPNIIGFIDYFVDNRFYYLVMELHGVPWKKNTPVDHLAARSQSAQPPVPLLVAQRNATGTGNAAAQKPVIGKRQSMDLFECIEANSRLSEDIARKIFSQVASAVHYLQSFRIVHRDIKDENIVVDQHFTVKLIDFGSALTIPSNGRLFDRFAGTLQYCPPEVLQGHKYRGPEQEVWALGILLYTILFSGAPFANVSQVLHSEIPIPRYTKGPSAGKPRASGDVVDLLRIMLCKSPADRATIDQVCRHPWLTHKKPAQCSPDQSLGLEDGVGTQKRHPLQQVEAFPDSPIGSPIPSPKVGNTSVPRVAPPLGDISSVVASP